MRQHSVGVCKQTQNNENRWSISKHWTNKNETNTLLPSTSFVTALRFRNVNDRIRRNPIDATTEATYCRRFRKSHLVHECLTDQTLILRLIDDLMMVIRNVKRRKGSIINHLLKTIAIFPVEFVSVARVTVGILLFHFGSN